MDPNEALSSLGNPWRKPWQMTIYHLVSAPFSLFGCFHMLSIVFLGEYPKHRCRLPSNVSLDDATPYSDVDGERLYDNCLVYENYSSATNRTIPCPNGWVYEHDSFTITEQWDLVCEKNFGSETTQVALVFGVLVGAMSMTQLSDKFGRKRTFLFNACAGTLVAFVTAWVNDYYVFTALRFLVGVFQQGAVLSGFVLACELFLANQRTMAGLLLTLYWPLGMVLLAAAAYFTRHWRHLLIVTSTPGLLLIPLFWIIPESLPWLIAKNRHAEARQVLQTAARWNKMTLPEKYRTNDDDQKSSVYTNGCAGKYAMKLNGASLKRTENAEQETKQYTALDIFASPKLRLYTLVMIYLWFVVCLVYFGLSLSSGTLAGNLYVNFCLSALMEVPAHVGAAILLKHIGRRWPICIFYMISGVSLLVTLMLPSMTGSGINLAALTITLNMIGKLGISAAFGSVFLYAPELFPTTVRNVGQGMASVGGRVGNLLAPYTTYFTRIAPWFPGAVFGTASLVAGVLTLLLPETRGRPLPQTFEEVERWTRCISKKKGQHQKGMKNGSGTLNNEKC